MPLVDVIVDAIVEVAREGRSRIATCALLGVSAEGWLKVELLRKLAQDLHPDSHRILPEWERIDLAVEAGVERVLVQLKTFPTNYGRAGKPITNFIAGVVEDLEKLSRKREGRATGLAAWMAYVIPEPVPPTWPGHLAKVQAAAGSTRRQERIPLWEKASANLYIMESK